MEIAIAEVYARGLYGAAMDSRSTDEVRDELHQMESIVKENKMFCRFLQDPAISKVIKKQKINAIFKGRVTDVTLHFSACSWIRAEWRCSIRLRRNMTRLMTTRRTSVKV